MLQATKTKDVRNPSCTSHYSRGCLQLSLVFRNSTGSLHNSVSKLPFFRRNRFNHGRMGRNNKIFLKTLKGTSGHFQRPCKIDGTGPVGALFFEYISREILQAPFFSRCKYSVRGISNSSGACANSQWKDVSQIFPLKVNATLPGRK